LSDRQLKNLYDLIESPEASSEILIEIKNSIFTLSELIHLIDIRLEELERQAIELEIVVEGRALSIKIKEEKMGGA